MAKQVRTIEVDLGNDLHDLYDIQYNIKELTSQAGEIQARVKNSAILEFTKLYQSLEEYPGSFIMKDDVAQIMIVPSDKYIKINQEKAKELNTLFGEGITEEVKTYSTDAKLFAKYKDVLEELIQNSDKISAVDKDKFFTEKTEYQVKKGTISSLNENYDSVEFGSIISETKPIFSLKDLKLV